MHIACGAGDGGISTAAHLPLEIVRSGTASIASILPQGQVSAAPTPPTPTPPCDASMHINVNASRLTPYCLMFCTIENSAQRRDQGVRWRGHCTSYPPPSALWSFPPLALPKLANQCYY
ncbi:unnamed protein product [Chrysodeixis includens]|uniref:Uncharacterized protein n=1 Tax=Chrysodeixis includens TaxID=689277 RepID=A0A9N8KUE7_CHRIL|nr:unnamed protein product [Chrysodeixis includens]